MSGRDPLPYVRYVPTMEVQEFLALPLVAKVAANGPNGPTVRPVWFLFGDGVFWWLTGPYSWLSEWLDTDSRVAAVIDTCDLTTGEVLAVTLTGQAAVHPLDHGLAARKLTKYLGSEPEKWPERFREAFDDPSSRLISLTPSHPPKLRDMSFTPPPT